MFLENSITVYDPLDRKLNLQKELGPFFVTGGTEWSNSMTKGIYVACGNYFVMKKMLDLGLKYVVNPKPVKSKEDHMALLLFCQMSESQGHNFSEEDFKVLKEIFSS